MPTSTPTLALPKPLETEPYAIADDNRIADTLDDQFTRGADVASAATVPLPAYASFTITGTAAVTAFSAANKGVRKYVTFAAALTLTHNATSFILPGGATITTAPGDTSIWESINSTTARWRCLVYVRADAMPIAATMGERAVQAVVANFNSPVVTGDGQFYVHIDARIGGMQLVDVHAAVITAGTTGTTDIQIRNVTQAADLLLTTLTIDSGETGSDTAATAAVIDTVNNGVTEHDLIAIDVDAVSTTAPKGLLVTLGFRHP